MKDCYIIQWNDAYSIGYNAIDKEHQTLFTLAQYATRCKTHNEIKQAVKKLVDYTKYHFYNEEQYMRSIDYININHHILIHKKIVKTLDSFMQKMDSMSVQDMYVVLNNFVDQYLIKHIIIEDKKVHHFRRNESELRNIFAWQDMYKLDLDIIDEEHKKLFDIALNTLNHSTEENPKEFIRNCINELYDYMKVHFEHEEQFMRDIKYPLYESHKKLHDNIIEQMNIFIKQIPKMQFSDFERKLIEYMDIWLISHIIYDDRKIQCHINNK